jgi:hypothetical protein
MNWDFNPREWPKPARLTQVGDRLEVNGMNFKLHEQAVTEKYCPTCRHLNHNGRSCSAYPVGHRDECLCYASVGKAHQ